MIEMNLFSLISILNVPGSFNNCSIIGDNEVYHVSDLSTERQNAPDWKPNISSSIYSIDFHHLTLRLVFRSYDHG